MSGIQGPFESGGRTGVQLVQLRKLRRELGGRASGAEVSGQRRGEARFEPGAQPVEASADHAGPVPACLAEQPAAQCGVVVELFHDIAVHRFLLAFDMRMLHPWRPGLKREILRSGMRKSNANKQPRLPSLDLLKGFEAAARLLSFTKAGEELYLSQSAVSRQIQELEEQLGVRLFERRHRALALTEAGQTLHAAAAQALATMRAVTDRLRAGPGRQTLPVTTTQSFASLWLIPRLAGFTRMHPELDVRISAETRVLDLERDGLDLAIRHGPATMVGPHALRLFGERVL